ncbi:HEPN domain-containing protein [Escherichia coli]|nr:HEPN domain-containing protein [Escherichia coli]
MKSGSGTRWQELTTQHITTQESTSPLAPQESHARIIYYLAGEEAARKEPATENQLKSLAYILREMKKKRIIADYKLEKTVSRKEAEDCIQQCNKLIKKISDINTQ